MEEARNIVLADAIEQVIKLRKELIVTKFLNIVLGIVVIVLLILR